MAKRRPRKKQKGPTLVFGTTEQRRFLQSQTELGRRSVLSERVQAAQGSAIGPAAILHTGPPRRGRLKILDGYLVCEPIVESQASAGRSKRASTLTDLQREVLAYIASKGCPVLGKVICRHFDISQSSLTSHIIPTLKRHGVKNRRGQGYYIG